MLGNRTKLGKTNLNKGIHSPAHSCKYSTTKSSHRLKVRNSQTMSINQYLNHFENNIEDIHQVSVQDHLK